MRAALAAVLGGALVTFALLDYRHYSSGQRSAAELSRKHALDERRPELAAEVRRHYDPVFAELRVARALLDDELDRSWMSELPAERQRREVERGLERLRTAAELAQRGWPRRPSSWEAALVLGGATYLELYRSRDPRLLASADLWERPLLAANRLGPAESGPVRFLTAAYVGNWASLSDAQRTQASALLAQGFEDPRTYQLLIRDWLRVAPSRRSALEPVPDRPWAWRTLQQIFAENDDAELLTTARERWHASLFDEHDATLEAARESLRIGDERRARNQLLTLLAELPRALEFAPTLAEVLEVLPPGPTRGQHAEAFAGWLDWAVELCQLRECPLPRAAFNRLARLSGDLSPERRATAFLLSGDLPRAQLVERRFTQASRSDWAGYFLLKAEELARRGQLAEAEVSLERLPRAWRQRPRYWLARRELARLAEDGAAERASEEVLEGLRSTRWSRGDWALRDSGARLELLVPESAEGLRVTIADASPRGAVVDVLWDGRTIAVRRTTGSTGDLELEMEISSGLHRLEIVPQFGGTPRPTDVALF